MASSNMQVALALLIVLGLLVFITKDLSFFKVQTSCAGPNFKANVITQTYQGWGNDTQGYAVTADGDIVPANQYNIQSCGEAISFAWIFTLVTVSITIVLIWFVFMHVIPGVGAS